MIKGVYRYLSSSDQGYEADTTTDYIEDIDERRKKLKAVYNSELQADQLEDPAVAGLDNLLGIEGKPFRKYKTARSTIRKFSWKQNIKKKYEMLDTPYEIKPRVTVGQRFGKLVITNISTGYDDINGRRYIRCTCACDCGRTIVVTQSKLLFGQIKNCGCTKPEDGNYATLNLPNIESSSVCYKRWLYIVSGQALPYAKEWSSYELFKAWSLNNGYSPTATRLIRLDPNVKAWTPQNCTWMSKEEAAQYITKRRKKRVSVASTSYYQKRKKAKMEETKTNIVTVATRRGRPHLSTFIPYKDVISYTANQWCNLLDIPMSTFYRRLFRAKAATIEDSFNDLYQGRDILKEIDQMAQNHELPEPVIPEPRLRAKMQSKT